jgi:flagellar hook protein FlgE
MNPRAFLWSGNKLSAANMVIASIALHLIQSPDDSVTQMKEMVRHSVSMSDVMSTAIAGLNASTARFASSANRVVEQPQADLAAELVQQKLAAIEYKANISVLKTADQMAKAALDIFV